MGCRGGNPASWEAAGKLTATQYASGFVLSPRLSLQEENKPNTAAWSPSCPGWGCCPFSISWKQAFLSCHSPQAAGYSLAVNPLGPSPHLFLENLNRRIENIWKSLLPKNIMSFHKALSLFLLILISSYLYFLAALGFACRVRASLVVAQGR